MFTVRKSENEKYMHVRCRGKSGYNSLREYNN